MNRRTVKETAGKVMGEIQQNGGGENENRNKYNDKYKLL
jgi:hypothetical protein